MSVMPGCGDAIENSKQVSDGVTSLTRLIDDYGS